MSLDPLHPFYQGEMVDYIFRRMFRGIEHMESLPRDDWAVTPLMEGPLTIARLYDSDREVHKYQYEVRRPELELMRLSQRRGLHRDWWSEPVGDEVVDVEPLPVDVYGLRTAMAVMEVSVQQLWEGGAFDVHPPGHLEVLAEFQTVRFRAVRYWLKEDEN